MYESIVLIRSGQYSDPEGGYFVLVNMKKVKLPDNYEFPANVKDRPRDFKLAWFLIFEVGVAAIPPSGKAHHSKTPQPSRA